MSAVAISGTVLDGKYVLRSALGGGRFGTVYAATHIALQKPVAVKVLHAGETLAAHDFTQFRVEAEALGRLDHANIVRVTDFGVDPAGHGTPYLVMELVDGRSIDEQPLPATDERLPRVAARVSDVAAALDHAHRAGVVHGDLSSRNVLVVGHESSARATVIDFGLARLVMQDHEGDGSLPADAGPGFRFTGTPEYAAPERLRGEPPSSSADVYALAVLAYRLVSGAYPFAGKVRDIVQARLTHEAPRLPEAWSDAPELDAVLRRGLAARAGDRPGALDFARAFDVAARIGVRRRWRRDHGVRRAAAVAVVSIVAALAVPWLAALATVQRVEGTTEDLRFALSASRRADARLQLVVLDDEMLAANARPLSQQASSVVATLERALSQGAAVVAFDLLLPAEWAADPAFEDFVVRHANRIVLAVAGQGGIVVGTEAVGPLAASALGPDVTSRLFALVSHVPAADGVVRRVGAARVDAVGGVRATLPGRVAALLGHRSLEQSTSRSRGETLGTKEEVLDYRVEAELLPYLGWQAFARTVTAGKRFDGQALLVGADFTGSGDRHRVPGPGRLPIEVSGLALQGVAANTLLQGAAIVEAPALAAGALTGTAIFVTGLPLLWCRRRWDVAAGAAGGVCVLAAGTLAAWFGGVLVPATACAAVWMAATGIIGVARIVLPGAPE